MTHDIWNATIDFTNEHGATERIQGLHATYIRGATEKINSPHVVAAFDAGRAIIRGWHECEIALKFDPAAPSGVSVTLFDTAVEHRRIDANSAPQTGGVISAEWRSPLPDGPAVNELLPTSHALAQLLHLDNGTAAISISQPIDAIISRAQHQPYGGLDPYAMGWATIDGTVRQLVARGVPPSQIVLLASLNARDTVGALVRCLQACHDASVAYRTPIVASQIGGPFQIYAAGPAPVRPIRSTATQANNLLFIVGDTKAEMGGSRYALLHGEQGGIVPQGLTEGLMRYRALNRAMREGLVAACVPILSGGLGPTLAQMVSGGQYGASVHLRNVPGTIAHDDLLLFSESIGRFLVEVAPKHEQPFNFQVAAEPHAQIGVILAEQRLKVIGYDGDLIINKPLAELNV